MKDALSLLKTGFRFIKGAYTDAFKLASNPKEGLKRYPVMGGGNYEKGTYHWHYRAGRLVPRPVSAS